MSDYRGRRPRLPILMWAPNLLLFLAALALGYAAFQYARPNVELAPTAHAGVLDKPLPQLEDFELFERSGDIFRSHSLHGRVWVASFFFTQCPGGCSRLNENISKLSREPALSEVTWVSITCDPRNDGQEELCNYADRYGADDKRWLFCRADLDSTKRVAEGMGMAVFEKSHQTYAVVIDREGRPRGMFEAAGPATDLDPLRHCIQAVLAEPVTPAEK